MPRPYRERKLIRALRGTDGYEVQKAAWDAVMPEWRRLIWFVNRRDRQGQPPLTDAECAELADFIVALNANNRFLAGPWYQLMMQDLYRGCPALGGWFPE